MAKHWIRTTNLHDPTRVTIERRQVSLDDFPRFAEAARAGGLTDEEAMVILEAGLAASGASGPSGPDYWTLLRSLLNLRASDCLKQVVSLLQDNSH